MIYIVGKDLNLYYKVNWNLQSFYVRLFCINVQYPSTILQVWFTWMSLFVQSKWK